MFEIIENDLTPELIEKYAVYPISKYLVYFDPMTYDILSITNEKRTDLTSFFEIEFEKVKLFLEGKRDSSQYKLMLNPSKTFEIVSKVINQDSKSSMLVPITVTNNASLTITHSLNYWEVSLSTEERERLKNNIIDYSVYIFVTSKDNKNALYRTLIINLEELIKNDNFIVPFENNIEKNISKLMLSTLKFFESYNLKYE
jgi:hypothetical protein